MSDPQDVGDIERREASDPLTPSDLLEELAHNDALASLVAGNPNASFDLLCKLAERFPHEVLANPVLPLLYLEDPRQFAGWPTTTALNMLREEEDLPVWFVDALVGHKEPGVGDAARHHVSRAGESQGEAEAIEAIKHAALNTYGYVSRLDLTPIGEQAEWLITVLADHHAPEIRRMIAAGRNRPEGMLVHLAGDPDEQVRMQIAGHPHTPAATLSGMAHDDSERVLQALARRKDLSDEMAILLAQNTTYQVRFNLADNASTPPQVLVDIAADDNIKLRELVAKHPSTPVAVLARLASDEHYKVREAVAHNPATPAEWLEQLAGDENDYVIRAIAQNPHTPEAILARLAERRRDVYLMEHIAARPALPETIQAQLAGFGNEKIRAALAANETLPAPMLAKLATDSVYVVREAVAANSATPPELLIRLVHDEHDSVSRAACMNMHIPVETLTELARGELRHRLRVAQHTLTPAEIITQLAQDQDRDVRRAIARRADLPFEALCMLAIDSEVAGYLLHAPAQRLEPAAMYALAHVPKLCIEAHIAEDTRTDGDKLAELARHENEHIRLLVAHNPNTPLHVIVALCDDGSTAVSKAARGKLGTYTHGDHSQQMKPVGRDLPIALHQRLMQLLLESYADQKLCDAHCLLLLSDPILPDHVLAPYVTSRWWPERYIVARHPNAGQATLERLAHDGNRFVRAAARERLYGG